jgi:hypothetical protein
MFSKGQGQKVASRRQIPASTGTELPPPILQPFSLTNNYLASITFFVLKLINCILSSPNKFSDGFILALSLFQALSIVCFFLSLTNIKTL